KRAPATLYLGGSRPLVGYIHGIGSNITACAQVELQRDSTEGSSVGRGKVRQRDPASGVHSVCSREGDRRLCASSGKVVEVECAGDRGSVQVGGHNARNLKVVVAVLTVGSKHKAEPCNRSSAEASG